jgi:hypothetical protein
VGFLFSVTFAARIIKVLMKKILVLTLMTILLASTAQAQWRFGVKGGANVSGFSTKSGVMDEQTPGVGFQLGGLAQYDFWILTFQPELRYSQRTIRIDDAYDNYYVREYAGLTQQSPDLDVVSHYLELPLNVLCKFKIGSLNLYGELGPELAYRLGGSFNGSSDAYSKYDGDMSFRKLDVGFGLGGGTIIGNIQLGARWDWYFSGIGTSKPYEPTGTGNMNVFHSMKYRNLSVSVGYLF